MKKSKTKNKAKGEATLPAPTGSAIKCLAASVTYLWPDDRFYNIGINDVLLNCNPKQRPYALIYSWLDKSLNRQFVRRKMEDKPLKFKIIKLAGVEVVEFNDRECKLRLFSPNDELTHRALKP